MITSKRHDNEFIKEQIISFLDENVVTKEMKDKFTAETAVIEMPVNTLAMLILTCYHFIEYQVHEDYLEKNNIDKKKFLH